MHQILILDYGSQYTQLIARRIRELNVYCEIHPFNKVPEFSDKWNGVILSGSPCSVNQDQAPELFLDLNTWIMPILGVCYGAQLLAKLNGGTVSKSSHREYGKSELIFSNKSLLFANVADQSTVWMSHADSITQLPDDLEIIGKTPNIPIAAFQFKSKPIYGIQFHPEVTHSIEGKAIIKNFVFDICKCNADWTPKHYIESTYQWIQEKVGNDKVIMGLSGGVDSTVAAKLIHNVIGDRLICIFIDNGLLRKNEFSNVLDQYKDMGFNVLGVDASEQFLNPLQGVKDPESKRKIIGRVFVEVFEQESLKIKDATYLGQGTIYPDVIESVSVNGPSATIKSHHNVGGLPEKMKLKILEPINSLFKDEVREVGNVLGIHQDLLSRHPFPGPGLGIRIIDDITKEKVRILQDADDIFISKLKEYQLYHKVWQAGVMFLPVQSVGVMGDERTYEHVVCLRAVSSVDGMTADWADLPHAFLAVVSNTIINTVKGINRVVYDISSKPPATIEWE